MIKKIRIKNFRCLQNFNMSFEDDLTLIVGENDAGKTTLVDALKIIFGEKSVEIDDFYCGTNEIEIEVNVNGDIFLSVHKLNEGATYSELFYLISHEQLTHYKDILNSDNFGEEGEDKTLKYLKGIANLIGVNYNSRSTINSLSKNIILKIEEFLQEEDPVRCQVKSTNINAMFLDGKHFEDITAFISELYFKEKRKSIWKEKMEDNKTLEEFIGETLDEYSASIENNINTEGAIEKIKEFLPELTQISIKTNFELRDININVLVQLLENDKEISINKKGDGTKRRITMALLDYKNNYNIENDCNIHVLDEPDTHLHVKAQMQLMNIMKNITKEEKQLIITTHSPFLINACRPQQIRLLKNCNNKTKIKYLHNNNDIESVLRNLGIENIFLFFAKKIVIVEGHTEEKFIPIVYERLYNNNLHSDLIKIVNVQGIRNVSGFANALLELNNRDDIYILIDNDADDLTNELISKLDVLEDHKFLVGNKEFEDSFKSNTIYYCWKKHIESNGNKIGELWTLENIQEKIYCFTKYLVVKYNCSLNE